jgi:ElaB/YqjD/DUF883 family membrane-anchored ribosome-binding protein
MATETKKKSAKATAKKTTKASPKATAKKSAKATAKKQASTTASKAKKAEQPKTPADRAKVAVDVPVGAALNLTEKVSEVLEQWGDQSKAEKKVKKYRANLTKTFKKAERRGTRARRKATKKVEKTYNRFEKNVRKQQKTVEKQIKTTNKDLTKRIDTRVDVVSKQAEKAQAEVSRMAGTQGKKAQDVVNRVTEQLTSLV